MDTIKLHSITIEGMRNCTNATYTFNDFTYLHGKNGAGKSTILNAIQLAILGYIPGINKTNAAIFKNASGSALAVTAVLTWLDKEIKIKRVFTKSGSGYSCKTLTEPEGFDIGSIYSQLESPVFNFNEFIGKSSNQLKDWFINFLPKNETKIDWEHVLKESIKDIQVIDDNLIKDTLSYIESETDNGVELVRSMNKYFKEQISTNKAILSKLQGTVQSLVKYEEVSNEYDLDEVSHKIDELNKEKMTVSNLIAVNVSQNQIKSMMNSFDCKATDVKQDPKYIEMSDAIGNYDKESKIYSDKIAKYKKSLSEYQIKLAEVRSKINTLESILEKGDICGYTHEKCDKLSNYMSEIQSQLEECKKERDTISEKLNKLNSQLKQNESAREGISQSINTCKYTIMDLTNSYRRYSELQSQLIPDFECNYTEEDCRRLENEISKLFDTKAKLQANKIYEETNEKIVKDMYKVQQNLAIYTAWEKLTNANGLQSKLSKSVFSEFETTLDTYVTNLFEGSCHSTFNVDSKANSFSFGLTKNNKYIPFDSLSSGEKCMYTLAMIVCLVQQSSDLLHLVMIDDLFDHLDDVNIDKLIAALKEVKDIQFILAGVKPVKDKSIVVEI